MNRKAFGLIVILIVVAIGVLLAGGGFYFKQSWRQNSNIQVANEALQQAQDLKNQIETAGWQTYQNEQFKYQIQYPPMWESLVCLGNVQFFLYSQASKKENCNEPRQFYDISIIGPTLEPGNIAYAKRVEEIYINGARALRFFDVPLGHDATTSTWIVDIVKITRGEGDETYAINLSRNSEIANQILSTFKFIE